MVDPANQRYASLNGILYDKTISEIVECPLGVESFEIPEGVKSIGACAFDSCRKLRSITIPRTLENIGNSAFTLCSALKTVGSVDLKHWCSLSIAGGGNPLSLLTGLEINGSMCTDIQIPYGVSNICANAFLMCSWLTLVSFPDSLKMIGEDAFCGCKGMKIVTLPFGVKEVGGGAFSSCTSLESIEIPSSVSEIGRYAFSGCDSLKTVFVDAGESGRIRYLLAESGLDVEGVDFIEGESRTPPDGRYRDKIDGVVWSYLIHDGEACVGGGEQAVSVYSGSVSIPVKLGGCPVTGIGAEAFVCTYLDSIFIPASIVQIDRAAFPHGNQLPVFVVDENNSAYKSEDGMLLSKSGVLICGIDRPSVNVPNDVVGIGYEAFSSCQKLVTLSLPNGLREIGDESFSLCDQLREIQLPNGLTNIGERAFYFCRGLESIAFPSNLTQLGEGAFSACVNLKVVEVPSGVTLISNSAFLGCSKLNSLLLPAGLTGIGNSAFSGCVVLDSLEIPKGVVEIGSGAFRDCPLKVISIPRSVVKIGTEAFTLGSIKTTITVEAGDLKRVKSLLSDAGVNISRVTFIEEGRGPGSWTDPKTDLTWEYCDYYYFDWDDETQVGDYVCDGGITIIKVSPNPVGVLQIPASINGRPVRSVDQPWCYGNLEYYDWGYDDEEFLNYCDELTSVIFPDTIKEIGPDMVRYCPNLTSVYLPEGLISIGKYSFMDCGLTAIEYPSTLQSDISYIWKSPIVSASIRGGNNDYFLFEDGGMYSTSDGYFDGTTWSGVVRHGKLIGSCRNIQTLSVREGCVELRYDVAMVSSVQSVFLPKSLKKGDGHAFSHNLNLRSVCFSGRPIVLDGNSSYDFYNDCPNVITYVPRNMGWEDIVLTETWQGRPIKYLDEYEPESSYGPYVQGMNMELDTGRLGYSAKGLPGGLSYDAKTGKISGKPKKQTDAGGVEVTLTKKGAADVMFLIEVRAEDISVGCEGLSGGKLPAGVLCSPEGMGLQCGAESDVKSVSVTKLPTGMKYDSKKMLITGAPTKAGDFEVVLTVTTTAGNKKTVKMPVTVLALPETAVGKFDGFVSVGDGNFGTFTLTTTDAGKLTAKVVTAAGTYSFSATGWDSVAEGVYSATLQTKKGDALVLSLDSTAAWDENQLTGSFTSAAIAATKTKAEVPSRAYSVSAQRNAFGKIWYFGAEGDETTGWTLAYAATAKAAALTVTLKADGTISIAGALPGTANKNGNPTSFKVSASGYANVGAMRGGAILADFAPILTVNKEKKVLSIHTNLWFDRQSGHAEGVGGASFQ